MENVNETAKKNDTSFSIKPNKLIYKQQTKIRTNPPNTCEIDGGTVKMQTETRDKNNRASMNQHSTYNI